MAETALAADVERIAGQVSGTFGVAVRDVETGGGFSLRGDEPFPLASVYKVPILVELVAQAREGRLSLDDRRRVDPENRSPGSGVLKEISTPVDLALLDLATLMIVISDNTATDHILALVGADRVRARMVALGLRGLRISQTCREMLFALAGMPEGPFTPAGVAAVRDRLRRRAFDPRSPILDPAAGINTGTPDDLVDLFLRLVRGTLTVGPDCELMMDILKRQQIVDRLPALLPPGTEVAHKTGSLATVRNDAGVIFARRGTVAVSVLARGLTDERQATEAIAEIGRAVYEAYS